LEGTKIANKRIYYAVQQVQIAPIGTGPTSYTSNHVVHGLQSVGVNTRFNLEQVFEIGQLAVYENIEELPDIEVTMEKVLDGYALTYHLGTPGATSATLAGRSNEKCQILLTIYDDTKDSASGVPITEVEMSGMFVSALNYQFPVQGNCTESTTFVGNNKVWRTNPSGTGRFPGNNDSPIGSGGVQRRQDVMFGSGQSVLPLTVAGITNIGGSGFNVLTSGQYGAHIQNIRVQANLGRENLNELGRKGPYHRYVNFPVEVTTEIECYSTSGDLVNALEDQDNITDEKILIKLKEGMTVDVGDNNKLNTVSYGGGNAGAQGGNVTVTYSYTTFNDLTIKQSQDPAGLYP
jgi:hypothetical protein